MDCPHSFYCDTQQWPSLMKIRLLCLDHLAVIALKLNREVLSRCLNTVGGSTITFRILVLHPSSGERASTAWRFLAEIVAILCILSCEPMKQTVTVPKRQYENRQKWPHPEYQSKIFRFSQASVLIHCKRQKKRRWTKEEMEGPTPLKMRKAWIGLCHADNDGDGYRSIVAVFAVLCVYCCFYFRCRTAG